MTKPIIDELLDEFFYECPMKEKIKERFKKIVKKRAHWNYPKYANTTYDILSISAYELIGDMTK